MLDSSEYERWMETARRTLSSARGDLERGDYNWACFKAQQAAEFAVKALLYGLGLPHHGHSVSRLLRVMPGGISVPQDVMQAAITLDKYYVPTRYPNAWHEGIPAEYYSRMDAEEAIRHAEEIVRWVERSWRSLKGG